MHTARTHSRAGGGAPTWKHLTLRAPDAQLAVAVVAPALDPATLLDRARVVVPQGDSDGGDACRNRGGGGLRGFNNDDDDNLPDPPTHCQRFLTNSITSSLNHFFYPFLGRSLQTPTLSPLPISHNRFFSHCVSL
jgi:hypothetical protein